MNDLAIVSAKRLLTVHQVSPIRGFDPPSILVRGESLGTTTEVYYNGVQALEFAVSSPTRLIVRIPPSQVGKGLDELQVFSSANVSRQDSALSLGIGQTVKTVSGMDRLIRKNVLAMSGRAVEAAGDVDTLLLDKTGTITLACEKNRYGTVADIPTSFDPTTQTFRPAPSGLDEFDAAAPAGTNWPS